MPLDGRRRQAQHVHAALLGIELVEFGEGIVERNKSRFVRSNCTDWSRVRV